MQAFFLALAGKLIAFLLSTRPDAVGKFLVGFIRPILVSQGVDRAETARILTLIANDLQGIESSTVTPDEQLIAEGGADIARGVLAYFKVTLADAALGQLLGTAAQRLAP